MNILIIFTDEQQRGVMGAYGNSVVKTSNLDRFAGEGTLFENAVCAQPVCTPSRASLMTGTFPHTHGLVDNYHRLTRTIPTIGELMIERGTRTGYVGKWHLGNEVRPQRGFEEYFRAIDDCYTAVKDLPLYGYSPYHHFAIEQGARPDGTDVRGAFSRVQASHLPLTQSKAVFCAQEAVRFLEARQDEPFLLVVSLLEPHGPFHSPYDRFYDRAQVGLPANFHTEPLADWPARNRVFQQWAREIAHGDEPALDTEEKWRDIIARYYGMMNLVDLSVGAILEKLAELGLDQDTLVIFTSDHGDMMGAHGIILKSMMFEESQGVPLIIRHPSVDGGRRIREPVNLVDLVPTALEAAGHDVPAHLQGNSLMPLLLGARDEDLDRVTVSEWNGAIQNMFAKHAMFADVKDLYLRSIRNARFKLTVAPGDVSELYDLQNDPGEMQNLVREPGHREVIDDLFGRLKVWQQETGDGLELASPVG